MTKPVEYDDVGHIWGRDNKLSAMAILRSAIERKKIKIYDLPFFAECNSYGFDEKGHGPEAAKGSNDDRVSAMMGLLYVNPNIPAPMVDKSLDMRPYEAKDRAVEKIQKLRHEGARSILDGAGRGVSNWD
jgi:hypothetical protein